ncbi:hypothetical protein EVAR_94467_1 [Eumeta japonica]|uniref:Uncharacterized protein n=1 Tax=Eumeta variegata TaxID=151549 RepID=A0A4C1UV96_EUMVA|nr:hypothetical protein EVAR_94467_1 [Eumeta japonica]
MTGKWANTENIIFTGDSNPLSSPASGIRVGGEFDAGGAIVLQIAKLHRLLRSRSLAVRNGRDPLGSC